MIGVAINLHGVALSCIILEPYILKLQLFVAIEYDTIVDFNHIVIIMSASISK